MRLWPEKMLPVLPRQQLISQWRECLAIMGAIKKNGTPNHRLVNKVLNYNCAEFVYYSLEVYDEMIDRGYKPSKVKRDEIQSFDHQAFPVNNKHYEDDWHTERYIKQCLYNLQEKYDCGIITRDEWLKIVHMFPSLVEV